MITDTTPARGGPHLPRNYYRRERRGNPIVTAVFIIVALLAAIWITAGMIYLFGTAPIRPNLAAQTEDFNRGVDVLGAADSRTFRQPGSSGGRITASESRALIFTRNDSAMQGDEEHD